MTGVYPLKGTVKHYDWGGLSFIPSLLNIDNKDNKPFAEYWMGTHPLGNSIIETTSGNKKLDELAGNLPYLFKAQEVKEMLSIQAHPSKADAEKEFARENAEGIPLDVPYRNYKDDNHKPEMLVALDDFWLLHGFKSPKELEYTLLNVVQLSELLPIYNQSGYAGLYKYVMEMPQAEVNRILKPLVDCLIPLYKEDKFEKDEEDFWAARAALTFNKPAGNQKPATGNRQPTSIDRGIFSIYLFNLVHLKRGEGIFQDAGVPHAYLEGKNVELMANSDNVLRGGLTNKHIDVKELLKHVKCEPTSVDILIGEQAGKYEKVYKTPAPEFQISLFDLKAGDAASFTPVTTEIVLLTDGIAELTDGDHRVELKTGSPSAVAFKGKTVKLNAITNTTLFRASVPVSSR